MSSGDLLRGRIMVEERLDGVCEKRGVDDDDGEDVQGRSNHQGASERSRECTSQVIQL